MFFEGIIYLCDLQIRIFWIFWFLKLYSQQFHLALCSDLVGIKVTNVAIDVLVAVDDSTKSELKGHSAVTESIALQTTTETGTMVAEAGAWLWVS